MVDPYDGLRVVDHGAVVEFGLDRPGVRGAVNAADQHHLRARGQGGAYRLGLRLASSRDLVLTVRSAWFVAPFVKLGLTFHIGFTWSLTRWNGWARSRRLLVTTETFDAQQGRGQRLADHLTDEGGARERVTEMPHGLPITRRLLAHSPTELDTADNAAQTELLKDLELSAAQAAFLARRPACVGGTR